MSQHDHFEEEEFDTQFNGQTVLRLIRQGLAHWPLMFGYLLAMLLTATMDGFLTFVSMRIIDEGILAGNAVLLNQLVIQYGLGLLLVAIGVMGFIFSAGRLGERVQYDLRKRMFARLQDLSLSYYDRTPVGWLMSRLTSDATRAGELVSWGFMDLVWGAASILISLVFMAMIDVRMMLILVAVVPILIVVSFRFKKKILVEYRDVRKTNSKITGAYNENITGVRVVKSLRREEGNLDDFKDVTRTMYRAGFRAAWLSALFLPVVQLISAVGVSSIVLYGGWQFQLGATTIGSIQAFIFYITFMLFPIQEMARVYAEMQQAIASGERIFSLIDAVPEIQDRPDAQPPPNLRGDIVFENVNFQYEEEKPVLRDFSLHVKQGETIALVGPTGAGKSTIVNLVCRFYEPSSGRILINGKDYTQWTLHGIHSRVGVVLQTPYLFTGSIMENLRYGRLDAADEDVVNAAKVAGAHEFIEELEDGYHSNVGEGGVLLSLGQTQLLSLARAILADPDVFVMDEATSSVDTLTEALVQDAMDAILARRTSFIIAHRLSTIRKADRILVIDDGRIAEQGNHAQLIRLKGHYYNLYTKQFRDERIGSAQPLLQPQKLVSA